MAWYLAANVKDFHTSALKAVLIDDIKILIVHLNGRYYAIDDLCTHDGGDLSGGEIEDEDIICPRHGARFCVLTGKVTQPPAYEDIATYPLKIVDDNILIQIMP